MSPAFVCELLGRDTSVLYLKLSAELEIARCGMPNVRVIASPKGVAISYPVSVFARGEALWQSRLREIPTLSSPHFVRSDASE